MAKSKTVTEWLELAKELERTYEEVSGTEIPDSVEEAVNEGWTLIPKGILVGGLIQYHSENRKSDRQRAIPLTVALKLLEQMEDSLIITTIKNPKQIFVQKTRGLVNLVRFAGKAVTLLWDVVKLAWEAHSLLELITDFARITEEVISAVFEIVSRFGGLIVSFTITAVALPVFQRTVVDVEKEREHWVSAIRKRALPQRRTKRVWRRKVSRL